MKIKFIFAWYDLWIGMFIDKNKRKILEYIAAGCDGWTPI